MKLLWHKGNAGCVRSYPSPSKWIRVSLHRGRIRPTVHWLLQDTHTKNTNLQHSSEHTLENNDVCVYGWKRLTNLSQWSPCQGPHSPQCPAFHWWTPPPYSVYTEGRHSPTALPKTESWRICNQILCKHSVHISLASRKGRGLPAGWCPLAAVE